MYLQPIVRYRNTRQVESKKLYSSRRASILIILAPYLFHNRCHTYILSSYQSMSCSIIETTTTVNMMYKSVFYPGVVHEINCLWKRLSNQNQIDFNMNWILKMSFSSSGSNRQPYVCLKVCRAMDQSVNEIVEYVSSLEASDTPHIQGLKAAMEEVHTFSMPRWGRGDVFHFVFPYCHVSMTIPQLETGRETLGVILNEKLDEILKETMQVTQQFEHDPNNRKVQKMFSTRNERLFQTTK